jgi:hypothetical protein
MKSYVIALILVVGVLGGFYGGYKVGQNNVTASASTSSSNRSSGAGSGFGGGFTGGRGAGAVCPTPGATPSPGGTAIARGMITNLSSTSMTITNTSCDVNVTFGPTVTITKTVIGSTADLQDNLTVTISGTRQADGSIKATAIVIGTGGAIRIGTGTGSGTGTGTGTGTGGG